MASSRSTNSYTCTFLILRTDCGPSPFVADVSAIEGEGKDIKKKLRGRDPAKKLLPNNQFILGNNNY